MNFLRFAFLFLATTSLTKAEEWQAISSLLQERCAVCHSGTSAPLGLHLDSYSGVMAGSENGPVVVPGATEASPLYHRIIGETEPRMPLDGPPFLSEAEIKAIVDWIASGAPGPATEEPLVAVEFPDPRADGRIVYAEVARVFGQACIKCHSDNGRLDAPPEGLRLDSYEAILAGGDRVVVLPGNAQASEIVRRIEGLASPRMPFDGPPWLSDEDSALIRDWIEGGALSDDGVKGRIPIGGRVRLRGVMTAPNEIDGAAFTLSGQTEIDEQPSVGSGAELRARVTEDGGLVAERLRERQ